MSSEDVKPEEAAVEVAAEVDPGLKKQLEFYFSDSNLPKDKFLLKTAQQTPEGWVSLQVIADFQRMKGMNATAAKLALAAKASDFLAVDAEEKRVRRTTPLPDTDVTLPRTVVAEWFAADTTIEDLHEFFSSYATVLSVRLMRPPAASKPAEARKEGGAKRKREEGDVKDGNAKEGEAKEGEAKEGEAKEGEAKEGEAKEGEAKEGEAKGGEAKEGETKEGEAKEGEAKEGEAKEGEVKAGEKKEGTVKIRAFIEFDTNESAKSVVQQEIVFKDVKISMQMKEEWAKPKGDPSPFKDKDSRKRGRDSEGGNTKEGGDQKRDKRERAPKEKKDKKEDMEANYKPYPKGVFVNVKGVGEGCTIQTIKDLYAQYGTVKFVEFKEGQTDACIRYDTPEEAAECVKSEAESTSEICGAVPTVRLVRVRVYIYIYMYIYIYIYIYIYTYIYIYMYIYVYIHIHSYIHTYMYMYMYTCTWIRIYRHLFRSRSSRVKMSCTIIVNIEIYTYTYI